MASKDALTLAKRRDSECTLSTQPSLGDCSFEGGTPRALPYLDVGEYFEDVEVQRVIFDGGSQSRVLLIKDASGDDAVVKIQNKETARFPGDLTDTREMLRAVGQIPDHKNVVNVFGAMEDDESFYTVMEPCTGGDLFEHELERGDPVLLDLKLQRVMTAVLSALEHLHTNGFVHNDVKPENFAFGQCFPTPEGRVSMARAKLMQSISKRPSAHVLKLLDFDFLRRTDGPPADKVLGTDGYIAPEAYEFLPCAKSDVFAAGVLMYVLVTQKVPFPDSIFIDTEDTNFVGSHVMGVIHASLKDAHGKVDWEHRAWAELPPEACAFCRWLLTFEVGQRPTASEALQGEWLRSSTPDPTLPRRASTWGAPEQRDTPP